MKISVIIVAAGKGIRLSTGMMQDKESCNFDFFRGAKFPDPVIQWFFTELNFELSEFPQK